MNSSLGTQPSPTKSCRIGRFGNRQIFALFVLAILLLYFALAFAYLQPRDSIENLDFWRHISLGYRPSWPQLDTFVNGFYPLGYPLLLRSAIDRGIDALRFGQFLSWIGGGAALFSLAGITYHITHKPAIALASIFLLLANVKFFRYTTYEGNDMLATGLQFLSIYVVWRTGSKNVSSRSEWSVCIAGFALGLAYLVRYQSLVLLPAELVYVLWKTHGSAKKSAKNACLLLGGFALAACAQIIPAAIVHGSPFYNQQAKNVWFNLYGQGDWVSNRGKVPDTISLLEVVQIDPAYFLEHWLDQVAGVFSPYRFWPSILHWAWIVGTILLVFDRRLHPANRVLAILVLVSPVLATAMVRATPRFLLTTMAVQALAITLSVTQSTSLVPKLKPIHLTTVSVLLILIMSSLQVRSFIRSYETPVRTRPQLVNRFLRAAGMRDPSRVATNDPYLHATDVPTRTRYAQTYAFVPSPGDVEELLSHPSAEDWRYLVFNYKDGFGDYSALKDSALTAKSRLVPLQADSSAATFCVAPCWFDDGSVDNVYFDNGMELIGHKYQRGEDGVSLYLYWQTRKPLTTSYKVSVRIQDTEGKVLLQTDNVPQLWTFSTANWPVDTPITDFYYLEPDSPLPDDIQIALVVYDERTAENARARDRSNQELGPIVFLERGTK